MRYLDMTRLTRIMADVPDGGDGGAGASSTTDAATSSSATPPVISKEAAAAMAAAIKEGLAGATFTAPAPTPAAPDPGAAAARADAIRKEINELSATGDYAAAMELMVRHMGEAQRGATRPVDEDPAFIALTKNARKIAAMEHAEAFKSYGGEIDAALARLAPAARLDPDAIARVVRDVRAEHMDEIIAAEVERRSRPADESTDEPSARGFTPMAGGSRGTRRNANTPEALAASLTAEQRGIADSLDITYEAYAKQVIDIGGRESRVELAPFDARNKVTPGRF